MLHLDVWQVSQRGTHAEGAHVDCSQDVEMNFSLLDVFGQRLNPARVPLSTIERMRSEQIISAIAYRLSRSICAAILSGMAV